MSLTIADLKNLQGRFDEVHGQIREPEFVRTAYVRFVAQMVISLKLKMLWFNPKFREAVNKIKRPFGWRRLAHQRMKKIAVKDFDINNLRTPNPHRYLGRLVGVSDNILNVVDGMDYLPQEENYWEEVFKPFLDIDEETKKKIEAHFEKIDSAREQIEAWANKLDYDKQKEFRIGQAEKLNAVFAQDGSLSHNPKTSEIYVFLLMAGEPVRQLGSREVIYEFMLTCMGAGFEYEFEAFNRLCTHIEYCGTTYTASMKRARLVDKHQARVLTE